MDGFLRQALQLLELSNSGGMQRCDTSEVRILMGGECGTLIIMQSEENWTLEALRQYHGASVAYRVAHDNAGTQVEGVSPAQTCKFRSGSQADIWKQLLGSDGHRSHFAPLQSNSQLCLEAK